METKSNGRELFYASSFTAAYFLLLMLNAYWIKSENIIVGFIQNLFTIPILMAQIILLFVALWFCFSDRVSTNSYPFWAFIFLLLTNILTLGSLYFS